jgi:hypothetical protein
VRELSGKGVDIILRGLTSLLHQVFTAGKKNMVRFTREKLVTFFFFYTQLYLNDSLLYFYFLTFISQASEGRISSLLLLSLDVPFSTYGPVAFRESQPQCGYVIFVRLPGKKAGQVTISVPRFLMVSVHIFYPVTGKRRHHYDTLLSFFFFFFFNRSNSSTSLLGAGLSNYTGQPMHHSTSQSPHISFPVSTLLIAGRARPQFPRDFQNRAFSAAHISDN